MTAPLDRVAASLAGWWWLVGVASAVVWARPWRHRARSLHSPDPESPRAGASGGRVRGVRGPARLLRRRTPDAPRDEAVAAVLPEVADLLLVGAGAGLTAHHTLEGCRGVVPAPFRGAFAEIMRRVDAGQAFSMAVDAGLAPLGPRARPLLAALVGGSRDGGGLAPALVRVGDEARRRRRVDAQQRARRLPVLLLFPLVLCVLPSFALLSLGPLVLASLDDLGIVSASPHSVTPGEPFIHHQDRSPSCCPPS